MNMGQRIMGFFSGAYGVGALQAAWRGEWVTCAILASISLFLLLIRAPLTQPKEPSK